MPRQLQPKQPEEADQAEPRRPRRSLPAAADGEEAPIARRRQSRGAATPLSGLTFMLSGVDKPVLTAVIKEMGGTVLDAIPSRSKVTFPILPAWPASAELP